LNRARDDQSELRVPMAMEDMGHVKHRRPPLRSGVEHFEERLEISVQIHRGRRDALKHQFLVAVIPPPMRAPDGKSRATASLNLKGLSVQRSGEDAANHFALFVLGKMNVKRRTLPVRWKRSRQMQFFNAVRVSDPAEREPFARVFEFDRQGWLSVLHRLPKYNGGHFRAQEYFSTLHFHSRRQTIRAGWATIPCPGKPFPKFINAEGVESNPPPHRHNSFRVVFMFRSLPSVAAPSLHQRRAECYNRAAVVRDVS